MMVGIVLVRLSYAMLSIKPALRSQWLSPQNAFACSCEICCRSSISQIELPCEQWPRDPGCCHLLATLSITHASRSPQ